MNWDRKWLVDLNAGKTQPVLCDWSNNTDVIDVKMAGSVLDKRSSFKMLGLSFSSKLDWGSYISSIAKTAPKKIGALIHSMKFLSPEVARNINVMSGLVLLDATWNCKINYKKQQKHM